MQQADIQTDAPPPPAAAAPTDTPGLRRRLLGDFPRWEPLRRLARRHGRALWWLHSTYALGLGTGVVIFANKGFLHARWLAATLTAVWLGLLVFFRWFGSGAAAQREMLSAQPGGHVRFFVVTYVLKNLYQGMLFFLLPFYWKAATLSSPNVVFLALLAGCAALATLDVVFDRVLMSRRALAAAFYAVTLFGALNLVIPAFFPNTRTLVSLLAASAAAVVALFTLHVPPAAMKRGVYAAALAASVAAGVGGVYAVRRAIPPVPMSMARGAVGPALLPDGRLAMEVSVLHHSMIQELVAVTDVVIPGGKGDRLLHVWRREGAVVYRSPERATPVRGPRGTVRLRSALTGERLPASLPGRWTIDVETQDGQLVGRVAFHVTE